MSSFFYYDIIILMIDMRKKKKKLRLKSGVKLFLFLVVFLFIGFNIVKVKYDDYKYKKTSDYAILQSDSEGITENIYANLNATEEFLKEIYRDIKIVIVKNYQIKLSQINGI